ncbi:MAG TPA: UvrD-helicase domain-containing protein [Acidobacteriaceae bacterium]|nr:UvrD-helicase domain-containing protein [Acidobacteriaceae bacterium]
MKVMIKQRTPAAPADQPERRRILDTTQSFLVRAPAGSGKTELLTRRFIKLLAEVDEPEQILAITFTLAATAEMRARVLNDLHKAKRDPEAEGEEVELARAALANDKRRGWNLLQQPQRLNLQTIDSVCLAIAHETPLLSRLGGSLSPTDKPEPMYTLAARRTLAHLGGEAELSTALRALLQWRGTRLADCQNLIAEMLGKRDQWGRLLPFGSGIDWQQVRETLEAPMRREHQRVLAKARTLFLQHQELAGRLAGHIRDICVDVDPASQLFALHGVTQIDDLCEHAQWVCLCDALLTTANEWRKRPPHGFASLLPHLTPHEPLLDVLVELRNLLPPRYSDEEWRMLQHMLVILRYAVAELRLVFAEHRKVDFVELGLAAREVLLDEEGELSELAADVAGRWRHLLVDEFQDTSRSQFELLSLLAGGWETAGHGSCFLVGDPMQSIYMFRQAEVELFERTERYGLGEGTAALKLSHVQLRVNFRSQATLVGRLNEIFVSVFEPGLPQEDGEYRVPFTASTAYQPSDSGTVGVQIWPFFKDPDSQTGPDPGQAEARQVVSIVQSKWPNVLAAEQDPERRFQIAVLVRARAHLQFIIPELRNAGIPFRAIEIEQLGDRQEVRDLTALTRALLHPMDRIAWLSVLRAPWCGLGLKDLHALCGNDLKEYAVQPVLRLLRERNQQLSADGQKRAARVLAVLETALRGKHRQASLARWVERTWVTLGGPACVDATGYENVRTYFSMLKELGPDAAGLEERLEDLCAQPDPRANERCGLQLMTIHKAKGLSFDVVIVPGLEREPGVEKQELLRWLEQTRLVGKKEREEHEFVVAPIGGNGQEGPIYRWIGRQKTERENEEAKRLLYVAATRPRRELHLLGTAVVKKDGQELGRPRSGSLLKTAWPALEPEFRQAFAKRETVKPAPVETQPQLPFPPMISLRRLPSDWQPEGNATVGVPVKEIREALDRPHGSLATRAFGTAVHALLEDLTRLPGIDAEGPPQALLSEVGGWLPRAAAMLRSAGLPRAAAESQAVEVVRALQTVLQDATGRWILGARAGAQTETSWSGWAASEGGEVVRTLRGDRIFRAGAMPCSREETHLWIVDYKTARHGASGLDAFLDSEKEAYQPQLEAYGAILRKVHGETQPIRMALYYPLLGRLVWW